MVFQKGTHPKTEFKKGHQINLGKKRPDLTLRNLTNNPTKNPSVARKISEARKIYNPGAFKKGHIGYKGFLGKHHTEENKKKHSEALKGPNAPNWRGGITPEINRRIKTFEWKRIRKRVLKRDNHTCLKCFTKENLDVHHVVPYRISKDNSLSNLVTLCDVCHTIEENKFKKYGITHFTIFPKEVGS